jgi:hypothetical protein
MGLTGYYRKFLKNYGKIVAPLTALLKNNSFTWTTTSSQAFQTLNMAMCTAPVLALPDFKNTFVLECDASGKGIGVVHMRYENKIVLGWGILLSTIWSTTTSRCQGGIMKDMDFISGFDTMPFQFWIYSP